ncbi:MAG: hypothetical protein IJ542_03955 [Clostridia bacterium]|nr:hypothetical protein [Clostridia bacterium]
MKRPSKKLLLTAATMFAFPLAGCSKIVFFYPKITADEYLSKIDSSIVKRALSDMNAVGLNYESLEFPKKEISYSYAYKDRDSEIITFYDVNVSQKDKNFVVNFSYETHGYSLALEDMGRSQYLSDDCIFYLGDIERLGEIIGAETSKIETVTNSKTKEVYYSVDLQERSM